MLADLILELGVEKLDKIRELLHASLSRS
jgi:hypothetical protein